MLARTQVDPLAPKLTQLLKEFGPSRKSYHAENLSAGCRTLVCVIDQAEQFQRRKSQTGIPKRELLQQDVQEHFTCEIADMLQKDSELVTEIASRLPHLHFAETLHQDILDAVGLNLRLTETVTRLRRNPEFRIRVLTACYHASAFCGFDVRLGTTVLAVEAAHIQ